MEPGVLIALAVVAVVAFVAGWIARGRAERDEMASPTARTQSGEAPPRGSDAAERASDRPPRGVESRRVEARPLRDDDAGPVGERPAAPDPAAAALRLLDQAASAFEAAVDRWLDEGDAITPAGRAALGELDRAIQRVDVAASRIPDGTEARFSALDALDALRQGATLLQPYREGRSLDAATSRSLDAVETELQSARDGLAGAVAH